MRNYLARLKLGQLLRTGLGIGLGRFHQYPPRPLSITALSAAAVTDASLPKVSIVTPSYNHVDFVGQTLRSVLDQAYPHLEFIVQDGASTDGSKELLQSFDPRAVTVISEADCGQTDALNRGFARSTGEIMAYLNSDDLFLPGTLNLVVRFFLDHPEVEVIYGNRLLVDEHGREIGRWVLPGHDERVLRNVDYVPQETLFWRRRAWNRIGTGLDANLHFAMDWDLILKFIDTEAVFAHVPELFGVFRVHKQQKSQAEYLARGRNEIARLRQQHRGDLGPLRSQLVHGNYLMRHWQADRAFEARLAKVKMEQQ